MAKRIKGKAARSLERQLVRAENQRAGALKAAVNRHEKRRKKAEKGVTRKYK